MHVSRPFCPSNMILLASGSRNLYILDEASSNRHYIACLIFMQTNIYIARKTSINVYIHLSDYCSGRKLKKIELSCTIKFSVVQTVWMWDFYMHKGKLIKEDIYARLHESKLFIGLLVNLISTLFPIEKQVLTCIYIFQTTGVEEN
jgi:hypothetical protein